MPDFEREIVLNFLSVEVQRAIIYGSLDMDNKTMLYSAGLVIGGQVWIEDAFISHKWVLK